MKNVKLQKGAYSQIGTNTYKGKTGEWLVLENFCMIRFLPGEGTKATQKGQMFNLYETKSKDVFEIDYEEEELFLEICQDKVKIRF